MTPMRYWYLRHGETDWNKQGLSQGRTDIPLNATGLAQAEAAGELLTGRAAGALRIDRIVSSPLMRALRTAEVAADALERVGPRPSLTVDQGLEEVCFGEQEGQSMGAWYDDWIAGHYTPPGAEPFMLLRDRAVEAVNRALGGPGTVMIVAHGALFRALRSAMHLPANVRLPNATPLVAEPPAITGTPWKLTVVS
ncbi:histidine phosphatase family protein [Acetobacter sp. LMG 1636]|uniref:Histidine phosphatase family protein n=2 Tax=Acetobacter fallax TaxID=1737473 RepID=A0ABX0KB33_9PROT|nr:histidine phosphatase family protein [Acetobacter fallax]NHO32388.1 histidine phosphatase family protein [Acetobacter fallax]NHO35944.1 histidine phosphatase family protein [Acetobacter fallax]